MTKWSLACALSAVLGSMAHADGWDIQFAEPFALDRDVAVMDLDVDALPEGTFETLTARGVKVLCYVSVGTAETYRDDWGTFPKVLIGKNWPEWPDEYYLDIRRLDVLLPIMQARFARCAAAGANGIEPDNQDLQWADSGFDISADDTVAYMRALADLAHGMGLTIGQKNNPDVVPDLVGVLDFIVTEDCHHDGWCDQVTPYIAAGKPVYAIEYTDHPLDWDAACHAADQLGLLMIRKDRDLNGQNYAACP
jgi:hypothetical protein